MLDLHPLARVLVLFGALLIAGGVIVQLITRVLPPLPLGQLPGDVVIERENFRLYIPLGTMIVLSIGLSILLNIIARLFSR